MKPLIRLFSRFFDRKNAFWLLLIVLVVLPVLSAWIGDILREWFTPCIDEGQCQLSTANRWLLAISTTLALLLLGCALKLGRELIAPRILRQDTDKVAAHPVLIALLSPQEKLRPLEQGWELDGRRLPDTVDAVIGIERPHSAFPWQQTLRAARHHHRSGTLKKLMLVGSEGEGGSGSPAALTQARAFFGHYLPGVDILAPGIDRPALLSPNFEDLEATRAALKKAIALCAAQDRDIIIDLTGGQKTASIAATLVTLDRAELMFQYMGTQKSTGRIFAFDAVTERSQS